MTDAHLSSDLSGMRLNVPSFPALVIGPQSANADPIAVGSSASLPMAAVRSLLAADDLPAVCRALAEAAADIVDAAVVLMLAEGHAAVPLIATAGAHAEFLRRILEADRDIRLGFLLPVERRRKVFEIWDLGEITRRALQPLSFHSGLASSIEVGGRIDGALVALCVAPTPSLAQVNAATLVTDVGTVAIARVLDREDRIRRERVEARQVLRTSLRLLGAEVDSAVTGAMARLPSEAELRPLLVVRAIENNIGFMSDLPVYLQRVVADVADLVSGARCRLAVRTGGDVVVAADSSSEPAVGDHVGDDRPLGRVAATGAIVNELGAASSNPTVQSTRHRDPEDAPAEVAVPIAVGGRVIGAIGLVRDRAAAPPFSEAEARALDFVARRLAPTLEMALHHDELKRAAGTDGLTRLANHRVFYRSLEEELDRSIALHAPLSVVLFDIDGLKQINDTRGHLAGDALLRQFSRLLEANVRAGDVVARYGGDEFAVIMPGADADQARTVGMRVRRALRKRSLTAPVLRPGAVTYGVATAPGDGAKAAELVATADHRLYAARGRRPEHQPAR